MLFGKVPPSSIGTILRSLPGIEQPIVRGFHMLAKAIPSYSLPVLPFTAMSPLQLGLNAMPKFGLQNLIPVGKIMLTQIAGFKVNGNIKRRCKDCYIVIRQRRKYIICPTHPRHKQMSMMKRDYKSWILTHATQSKIRPY